MSHTTTYFELLDAFAQEGCPVCRLSLAAVHRFLEGINYEGVNDTGVRARTRAAFGFCNRHSHQWLKLAHVLGTALIYKDVVADVTVSLRALRYQRSGLRGNLPRLAARRDEDGAVAGLVPSGDCLACQRQTEETRVLVATLTDSLRQRDFQVAYAESPGVCLPHLREALRAAPTAAVFETLRDHAVSRQEQLASHLGEVARKHDYRYSDEPLGEEREAAVRVVAHVAGARGVR
ncbi:MAG: DUF6062 family protein [Thermomicrobiales bacterium]